MDARPTMLDSEPTPPGSDRPRQDRRRDAKRCTGSLQAVVLQQVVERVNSHRSIDQPGTVSIAQSYGSRGLR